MDKNINLNEINKKNIINNFYNHNKYYLMKYKNDLSIYNNYLLNVLCKLLYDIFYNNNNNKILINFYYNYLLYNENIYTKVDNLYAKLQEHEYVSESINNNINDTYIDTKIVDDDEDAPKKSIGGELDKDENKNNKNKNNVIMFHNNGHIDKELDDTYLGFK